MCANARNEAVPLSFWNSRVFGAIAPQHNLHRLQSREAQAALEAGMSVPWGEPDRKPFPLWLLVVAFGRSAIGISINEEGKA
jgi:hypothetical protein